MPTVFNKLADQFDELYPILLNMMHNLETIEPGGTLIDEVVVSSNKYGSAFVSYSANPMGLAIERGDKKFILKIVDL